MLEESELGIPDLGPYTYNCRLPPTTSVELVRCSFGDQGDDDGDQFMNSFSRLGKFLGTRWQRVCVGKS